MQQEKYTVICDARFGKKKGISTLVMIDKKMSSLPYWWTATEESDIIRYSRPEAAEKAASALKNNARAVKVSEALEIMRKQRDLINSSVDNNELVV